MTEMVERVARMLCEDFGLPPDGQHWDTSSNNSTTFTSVAHWTRFVTQARVAIAAMREPTAQMIDAFERLGYVEGEGQNPKEAWQAMIDAALEEK